jgi:hypothetical protein
MEPNGAIPNTGNEAPASWTVRYHTPEGFDAMLTLRGGSGADVLRAAAKCTEWLVEHECTPDGCKRSPTEAPPPVAVADPSTAPNWCAIHQATMKMHTANGESWYSHKIGDEWCRGGKAK